MGMRLELMRISSDDLAMLKRGTETTRRFIEANLPVIDRGPDYARAVEEMRVKLGLPPAAAAGTFSPYPFNDVFNVDKMWNGLYFLLTGSEDAGEGPATCLLNSPPVNDEEIGYGPAMVISPDNTRALGTYLAALDRSEVLASFNGAKMMELQIYPGVWDEDAEELTEELGDAFDALRAYCCKCADHGLGMLSYVT